MKVVKKMIDMGLNLYKRNSFVRFLVVLLCFSILYCIMDYNYGGNFITYDDIDSGGLSSFHYRIFSISVHLLPCHNAFGNACP